MDSQDQPPVSEPVVYKDTIIIGEKCYSMKDGSIIWNLKRFFENERRCATIVVGQKAFIPLNRSNMELLCVDAETGKILWSYYQKGEKDTYWRSLLSGGGIVYANFGYTMAFDLDGNKLWKTDDMPGQMAFVANHLIVSGGKGTFCLSPKTGKVVWSNEVIGYGLAICGGKILTSATNNKKDVDQIVVLSVTDGKELGRSAITKIPLGVWMSLVVGAGKVFIGRPWQSETYCYGDVL